MSFNYVYGNTVHALMETCLNHLDFVWTGLVWSMDEIFLLWPPVPTHWIVTATWMLSAG